MEIGRIAAIDRMAIATGWKPCEPSVSDKNGGDTPAHATMPEVVALLPRIRPGRSPLCEAAEDMHAKGVAANPISNLKSHQLTVAEGVTL